MVSKKEVQISPKKKLELVAPLKAELIAIKEEIRSDVVGPVVASFGFIIALVWRDAIKGALDVYLQRAGLIEEAYLYNFLSAVLVTFFVIAIMIAVTKFGRARRQQKIEEAVKEGLKK